MIIPSLDLQAVKQALRTWMEAGGASGIAAMPTCLGALGVVRLRDITRTFLPSLKNICSTISLSYNDTRFRAPTICGFLCHTPVAPGPLNVSISGSGGVQTISFLTLLGWR